MQLMQCLFTILLILTVNIVNKETNVFFFSLTKNFLNHDLVLTDVKHFHFHSHCTFNDMMNIQCNSILKYHCIYVGLTLVDENTDVTLLMEVQKYYRLITLVGYKMSDLAIFS